MLLPCEVCAGRRHDCGHHAGAMTADAADTIGSTGKGGAARCCGVRAAVYLAAATAPGVVVASAAERAVGVADVETGSVGVADAADETGRLMAGFVDENPRARARDAVVASRMVWYMGSGGRRKVVAAR